MVLSCVPFKIHHKFSGYSSIHLLYQCLKELRCFVSNKGGESIYVCLSVVVNLSSSFI